MLRKKLIKRQETIQAIRNFFALQDVIEVTTPSLLKNATTDIYIDSISSTVNANIDATETKYLHTSPELEMKKLLIQGSGDIYQICTVFRDNEHGEHNFNEFSMLEYYRLGFNIEQLMDNVVSLLRMLNFKHKVVTMSYAQAFDKYCKIDILNTNLEQLKQIANKHGLPTNFKWLEDLQSLFFVHFIEPKLKNIPLCFIYDYPANQAALAKIDQSVAKRFELYIYGAEIANGYDELQNIKTYCTRFNAENNKRKLLSKNISPVDNFFSTHNNNLPQCSGVAIGLNRLLTKIS